MYKDDNGKWYVPAIFQKPVSQNATSFNAYPTASPLVTVPLSFWLNNDPRLSIPQVVIPFGQRQIQVTLQSAEKLLAPIENTGG